MDAFAPRFPFPRIQSWISSSLADIPADRDLATAKLFHSSSSLLINREFNFQPMTLSKKRDGIVLRGYIIWQCIIGRVLTERGIEKAGVKTLLATRTGARNPPRSRSPPPLSLSPLLNRNRANGRQCDSEPDGDGGGGGGSR